MYLKLRAVKKKNRVEKIKVVLYNHKYNIGRTKGHKMKKTLLGGGVLVFVLTILFASSVFAIDPIDTIKITIMESCTIARQAYTGGGVTNNTSHKNGTGGTWSTTANTNTLSATIINGQVKESLGSSQFKVVCNHASGYSVTVATTDLSTGGSPAQTIPNNTTYSASVSGWSPIVNSTRLTNGGVVKTESSSTSGTTFEVFYGAGISTTQAAGTYTGTATYSIIAI